ncbi:hypothetical protein MRB53_018546 [Persea americana]|uniref:Uncharacterized protein n=1 Tax=Persea americana TaxID=3435 RepID=A0ACC2M9L9_PERAE|nr:hypothetical protein MRB53_018546 [Persea americana]
MRRNPNFCSQKPQQAAARGYCLFPEEGVSRKGRIFVDDEDNEKGESDAPDLFDSLLSACYASEAIKYKELRSLCFLPSQERLEWWKNRRADRGGTVFEPGSSTAASASLFCLSLSLSMCLPGTSHVTSKGVDLCFRSWGWGELAGLHSTCAAWST